MASNGAPPNSIPDVSLELKFDGGVRIGWTSVKRRIIVSLKGQGLLGYVNRKIPEPTIPPISISAPGATPTLTSPVFSNSPSYNKWVFRNDRAKNILEFHFVDLISIMPDFDAKTAREAFDDLETEFGSLDGMQMLVAKRQLWSLKYREKEPLDDFFTSLQTARKANMEAGNLIDNLTFRKIVLGAFPTGNFDPIINNILAHPSSYPLSASVIIHISYQYEQIEKRSGKVSSGDILSQANTASTVSNPNALLLAKIEELIAAKAVTTGNKNTDKKCHNCSRMGHVKEDCFRKGGGKEGQFPDWW